MLSSLVSFSASCLDVLFYGVTRGAAGIAILFATGITTLVVVTVPLQLHRISFAPKDIPWVGQKGYTWSSKLRSTLVALKYERSNLEEGWEKVRSCIVNIKNRRAKSMAISTAAKGNPSSDPRYIGRRLYCLLVMRSGSPVSLRMLSQMPKYKTKF